MHFGIIYYYVYDVIFMECHKIVNLIINHDDSVYDSRINAMTFKNIIKLKFLHSTCTEVEVFGRYGNNIFETEITFLRTRARCVQFADSNVHRTLERRFSKKSFELLFKSPASEKSERHNSLP